MGGCSRLAHIGRRRVLAALVASIVFAASAAAAVWVVDRSNQGVVLTVWTDKKQYSAEETVTVVGQLKNQGLRTVELVYNTSRLMFFIVYDSEGTPVFSPEQPTLPVITHVYLEPGGTRGSGFSWNQVSGEDEEIVPPGFYSVRAFSSDNGELLTATTTFSISD